MNGFFFIFPREPQFFSVLPSLEKNLPHQRLEDQAAEDVGVRQPQICILGIIQIWIRTVPNFQTESEEIVVHFPVIYTATTTFYKYRGLSV